MIYINEDPRTQDRATKLGCGWMPAVPPEFVPAATAPCVIVRGAGQTVVISDAPPTTRQAVDAAAAPILAAEQAATDAAVAEAARQQAIHDRVRQALVANRAFMQTAPLPASPNNAQVVAKVRALDDYLHTVARELQALLRITLNDFSDDTET